MSRVVDPDAPLVLVETGEPDLPPSEPVVTKDDSVTIVALTWDRPMPLALMQEAVRVLGPLRGAHPRFATVLGRLHDAIRVAEQEPS